MCTKKEKGTRLRRKQLQSAKKRLGDEGYSDRGSERWGEWGDEWLRGRNCLWVWRWDLTDLSATEYKYCTLNPILKRTDMHLKVTSHKVLLCGPQAAERTTVNFVPPKFMSGFFRLIESQQKEIDGSLFFKQSCQCDIMSHLSFIKCKWKRTNSVRCKADDSETLTATVWWHHRPVLQLAPTSRFAGSFPSTLWKEKPKAWTFVFALTSAYDDYTRSIPFMSLWGRSPLRRGRKMLFRR